MADEPMSEAQQTLPRRLWHMAREYLTHWAIAGAILTLTGFTPDHWVERVLHLMRLPDDFSLFSGADFRHIAVGVGVVLLTGSLLVRMWRPPVAAPAHIPGIAIAPESETASAIEGKPSIAVLPFVNMSDDKSQEYFADGMTEDIITGLSYDSRLFVIARNSTAAYKGQTPDVRAVGKELGVRYVLEGSIRPQNDMLRITVQLVETTSGAHVWADRIDRPITEIFAISDAVVDGLVMALCSNLGAAEATRAARQRPEDLQAWALCMQAENIHAAQLTPETARIAAGLARRATEIEPAHAPGWAILAYLTSQLVAMGLSTDETKDLAEVRALADKALRLAPNDAVVLGYCGTAFVWSRQTERGAGCLERSLALNPNNGWVRLRLGFALWASGAHAAGLAHIESFFRLSPRDPNAGIAYTWSARCYFSMEDFPRAEEAAREAIKLLPGFWLGYLMLALALKEQGRIAEAFQAMRSMREAAPYFLKLALSNNQLAMKNPWEKEKFTTQFNQLMQDWEADEAV
jgi:TolB-like protein/Tfp pilus assembly protein PilF